MENIEEKKKRRERKEKRETDRQTDRTAQKGREILSPKRRPRAPYGPDDFPEVERRLWSYPSPAVFPHLPSTSLLPALVVLIKQILLKLTDTTI